MPRNVETSEESKKSEKSEKSEKSSPVPTAAVVALESELTVASTNASPTLLIIIRIDQDYQTINRDLNPIKSLKTN